LHFQGAGVIIAAIEKTGGCRVMRTIKALCFRLCVAVTTAGASAADLRMGVASEVTTLTLASSI
jgi:hypothetical protein